MRGGVKAGVKALRGGVKALCGGVKALCGGVTALCGGLKAWSGGVKAWSGGDKAGCCGLRFPGSKGVKALHCGVKAGGVDVSVASEALKSGRFGGDVIWARVSMVTETDSGEQSETPRS